MQSKLYFLSKIRHFKFFFKYQTIFLSSFSTRLYVVKNILTNLSEVLDDFFLFDSFDKINLSVNLKNYNQFSFSKSSFNQVLKNYGVSFNFIFVDVYNVCLDFLFGSSTLPVLDAFLHRFHYKLRPFVESNDSLYYGLLIRGSLNFSSFKKIDLLSYSRVYNIYFFLKGFPARKKALIGWVSFFSSFSLDNYFPFLFCNLFDFLFVGLVRFGFVNFLISFFI